MNRPENVFPRLAGEIIRRRASDPEFDEICRDFELLANNRETARRISGNEGASPDPDIEDSLADLSREIKALLRLPTTVERNASSTERNDT